MHNGDQLNQPSGKAGHPRRSRFDLFYYEREGGRYYLRFTRFALALFIIFPLLIILLLVVFFLSGSEQHPIRDIDVTIKPPPAETPTPRPTLNPTRPPRTAPAVRRGPSSANTHAVPTPSPGGNTNE